MKDKLDEIRSRLDSIDKTIIDALAERQKAVQQVFSLKAENSGRLRDYQREEQILSEIGDIARKAGLDRYFAEQIFREIINHSVRTQTHALMDYHNPSRSDKTIRVAYQGTEGAFSHVATQHHFGDRYADITSYGYDTFQEAGEAVENGDVDVAILPIENTTAGSINETYDLLGSSSLVIVGEEVLRIRHCLLALEPVPIERIRRIISHPQALAQCSRFLSKLTHCHVESYLDTALAARKVQEDGDLSLAAIAGAQAAEQYGLHIIERDIANQDLNFTRFVIVAPEPVYCDPQIPCKTSLVMATSHEKGALIDCLRVLGDHGINMTKLESRPRPNVPWQYLFYLDIEGNTQDENVEEALNELKKEASFVKILGCYPIQPNSDEVAKKTGNKGIKE
ncbi:MAG TPA: prephenate dehydratase [Balneolales bacterium]|nr:prephenate dehydratase [Balneolales bacterium]